MDNQAIEIAIVMLKVFEGCRLRAYKPVPTDPWTIGYGATGKGIGAGTVWTPEQAEADLRQKVKTLATQIDFRVDGLKPYQKAALISFAYNLGMAALSGSTLMKRLKEGKIQEAADQILRWDKDEGRPLKGLTLRRKRERLVFLGTPVHEALKA